MNIYQFQELSGNRVVKNDVLYFAANDSHSGMEIWKSDGSIIGTSIHYESNAGFDGTFFNLITVVEDRVLWYHSHINATEPQLTASDLDGSNVELLDEFFGEVYGWNHFVIGSEFYYVRANDNDIREIMITDGTIAGTTTLNHGGLLLQQNVMFMWKYDGNLLIMTGQPQGWDRIFSVDAAGTITQFGTFILHGRSLEVQQELFFVAGDDGVDLCEVQSTTSASFCGITLFRTDGTLSNTELFLESGNYGEVIPLHEYNGLLFFTRGSGGLYTTVIPY